MKPTLLAILIALAAQGCATNYSAEGVRSLEAGDYAKAEASFQAAIRSGDNMARDWDNLGVLYYRASASSPARDDLMRKAAASFTMAARYGSTTAQQRLVRLNLPVPPADLMGAQKRRGPDFTEVLALGALAVATKGASAPSSSFNCTSTGDSLVMRTNCN